MINKYNVMRRMYTLAFERGWGHLASSSSALPIMLKIYKEMLPEDTFVLSKGHSCMALYAILQELGYNPDTTAPYGGYQPKEGISYSCGSLGHGLPFSAGIAFAEKLKSKTGMAIPKVYCLVGDGELQEGTTWETYLLIYRFHLKNLFVTIDANDWQACKPCYDNPASDMMNKLGFQKINSEKGQFCELTRGKPYMHTFYMTKENYDTVINGINEDESKAIKRIERKKNINQNYVEYRKRRLETLRLGREKLKNARKIRKSN